MIMRKLFVAIGLAVAMLGVTSVSVLGAIIDHNSVTYTV